MPTDKSVTTKRRRWIPYRSYDQMLEDGDLPPYGTEERIVAIMAESYMRGMFQAAIGVAILGGGALAWSFL